MVSRASPATLDLRVERPVAGGAMLARHQGQVVLVTGAIPGERVRARVDRRRHDVILATATEIIEPDPDRRVVDADPSCGGQRYRHIAYRRQLALKSQVVVDALAHLANLRDIGDVRVAPSTHECGYRMRARFHVGPSGLGFLREGTDTVCDAAQTGQLRQDTAHAVAALGRRLKNVDGVRHVDLMESMAGDQRVFHFHLRRNGTPETIATRMAGGECTGASWTSDDTRKVETLHGNPVVSDAVSTLIPQARAAAGTLARHAASFFQANRYLLPTLVAAVCRRVTGGPVLDLYAGVGLFGVSLAVLGVEEITAVERDRVACRDLRVNVASTGRRVELVHASSEAYLTRRSKRFHGTAIVDPPRTGLSPTVVERVVALRVPRLVYVSCDAATFSRDVRRLTEHGYALGEVETFDMLPNTAHVEIVATLERHDDA